MSEKKNSDALETIEDALELARAGTWDAHYVRGLSVEYARSVDRAVRHALAAANAQERRIRDLVSANLKLAAKIAISR